MTYHSSVLTLAALSAEIDLLDPTLPVAVAVIDLDGFGPLNEEQGDEVGDAILGAFEHTLVTALPRDALVAHVRGDEFAVALADRTPEEALLALEAARAAFANQPVLSTLDARLGVSVGVAGRPAHGSTADELFEAADTGLVRAKRAGGNRVALHMEERMIMKTSYYPRPALHRLSKLSRRTGRPEASLLREALEQYLEANSEPTRA